MDPDATLTEQLELASRIQSLWDRDEPIPALDSARLSELVLALHEWTYRPLTEIFF